MEEYHKIKTLFARDPDTNHKLVIKDQYSCKEFEYLKDNLWVFTEKVDGTNIRVRFDGNTITFGGKTDNAQIPAQLVMRLNEIFLPRLEKFKDIFTDEVCLYGEGYGAKIQKGGGKYRPDPSFVLFDVKIGEWWLERPKVEEIADNLGLDIVPMIGTGKLSEMVDMCESGFESKWGQFKAEGIVARPLVELQTRGGERIITKLKYIDFVHE